MNPQTLDNAKPKVVTGLDWPGYYKEFSAAHGDNPILYGGVLLFEDGWTYSSTDHSGPEWPPPSDPAELTQLLRAYWLRRRAIVSFESFNLQQQVNHYEDMQRSRKIPLQQFQQFLDMEAKRWTRTTGPLDIRDLQERLEWLTDDIALCDQKLEELEQ